MFENQTDKFKIRMIALKLGRSWVGEKKAITLYFVLNF